MSVEYSDFMQTVIVGYNGSLPCGYFEKRRRFTEVCARISLSMAREIILSTLVSAYTSHGPPLTKRTFRR